MPQIPRTTRIRHSVLDLLEPKASAAEFLAIPGIRAAGESIDSALVSALGRGESSAEIPIGDLGIVMRSDSGAGPRTPGHVGHIGHVRSVVNMLPKGTGELRCQRADGTVVRGAALLDEIMRVARSENQLREIHHEAVRSVDAKSAVVRVYFYFDLVELREAWNPTRPAAPCPPRRRGRGPGIPNLPGVEKVPGVRKPKAYWGRAWDGVSGL